MKNTGIVGLFLSRAGTAAGRFGVEGREVGWLERFPRRRTFEDLPRPCGSLFQIRLAKVPKPY